MKARVETGPFGEPIFPEAEPDLEMDSMIRYRTKAEFAAIERFYEEQFGDRKDIQRVTSEDKGFPVYSVGVGPGVTDFKFGSIVVMIDHSTIKKRKQRWHILVVSAS